MERRWDAERRSLDAEVRELEELLTRKRSEYQACIRKKDRDVQVAGRLVLQSLVDRDAALSVAANLRALGDQQQRRLIAMELKEADTAHTNERLTVEFAFGNALRQLRE